MSMAASLPAFNGGSAAAAIDGRAFVASIAHGEATVVACSALRRAYRDRLRAVVGPSSRLLYLKAESDEVSARVAARLRHSVRATLVASRFVALEPPEAENDVISMPFHAELSHALSALAARLKHSPTKSRGC